LNQLALTIEEACDATRIGKTKMYEALDSGELPAKKWGKRTLILAVDLKKYLASLESYVPQIGGQND
jgi:excisionase family DNA binding protein